jgi:hypothetical protein
MLGSTNAGHDISSRERPASNGSPEATCRIPQIAIVHHYAQD